MEKKIKLLLTLEGDMKIISVNATYRATVISGHPTIYKTGEAKRMTACILNALRAIDFSTHLDWMKTTTQFTVTYNFVLKSGFKRRDVGNFEKVASDTLVDFFRDELGLADFDDSKFTDLHLYKQSFPGAKNEYIIVTIEPSILNTRLDVVDKPNGISLFNLDPSDLKIDKRKKIKFNTPTDDTSFFYITASIFSPEITAKIIDSAYTKKSVYIAVEDLDWTEDAKQEMNNVLKMIKDKDNVHIKKTEKKEDIKEWLT